MSLKSLTADWGPFVFGLGVTQIIGYGAVFYAYPVLVPAIAVEFGVAAPVLYAIFSAGLLAGGVLSPILGRQLDRLGAAQVMAAGSLAAALLTAGMALASGILSFAVAVILLQAISFAVLYDAAFATLAAKEPADTRSAITRLTLIGGFASTLFWPLAGFGTETVGWRGTLLGFALAHLVLALPLHLWMARRSPRWYMTARHTSGGNLARPVFPTVAPGHAASTFWILALGFSVTGLVIAAIAVHMVPVLVERGLGQNAFLVAMLMGPAQVAIRLVEARFWRRFHPLGVAMISSAAVALAFGALLLGGQGVALAIVFAVTFGAGQGLASIVRGAVPLALFGAQGIGARLGQLAGLRNIAAAAAPFLFAFSVAKFGLDWTLWVCVGLGVAGLGALVVLSTRLHAQGRWTSCPADDAADGGR